MKTSRSFERLFKYNFISKVLVFVFVTIFLTSIAHTAWASASPRDLKLSAIENLTDLPGTAIQKAIFHIQKSLDDSLWEDDSHLTAKKGRRVFRNEYRAAKLLERIAKNSGSVTQALEDLVCADNTIAEIAFSEARAYAGTSWLVDFFIKMSEKHLQGGERLRNKKQYSRAIKFFEKSWRCAQLAIRYAPVKPTVSISADPAAILYGETSELSWSSTNADSCVIEPGIGSVEPNGSTTVSPTRTTTYTITATGHGSTAEDEVTIQIVQNVPPCISITNPVNNSTITFTTPYITIEFSDEDSDINLDSLNVKINGADYTSSFDVTDTRATYQVMPPLPSGSNVISASISDNAGNTSAAVSDFTVDSSTEPIRYIFSVSDNDWIFASPGDGTCVEYLSQEDLGLLSFSDVVALSRVKPDGDVFFTLSGQGGILQSPGDGSSSMYFDNLQLGLEDDDQILAEHTGLDGAAFFAIKGQPDVYESSGDNTHSFFMQNAQLGLADSVQVQCLHIGYDSKVYFCRSDEPGIFESTGDGTNTQFLTSVNLGVPDSTIDSFAILPENIPPTISITNPSDGSTIDTMTPDILISFSDADSGVDTASFAAEINGTDSTSLFDVTLTGASYQVITPLPMGDNIITASISDNVGNQSSAESNFTVEVFQASLSAIPTIGGIPLEVQFSAEIIGGTSPYTFEWDLDGDGTVDDTRESFSYVYQTRGIYLVTLTVMDATGETVSDTETIYALSAPTVIASAIPTSGGAPLDVVFSAIVNDPDGTIVLYEWDFDGDGTYDYSDPNTASTTFKYETAGLYQATIRVTDNDDLTGTDTIPIAVGASPSASAAADPMTGPCPLEVTFTGTGSDDGTIALYEWDFDGDGTYDWSSTTTGDVTYLNLLHWPFPCS